MTAPNNRERILPRLIDDEIKESFINYSMSVIVSRALPDVRDGLKPVHRRVLYSMFDTGLVPGRPYKKAATVVGDVLGKYHPHGDASVYDALVRMVQDFSLRYPLIDGQGNFGSVEGDPAAAYRYTEARLMAIAMELLADIDKNTVAFTPNFDDHLQEPSVLPAGIPNLVVNGSSGIAVGMATNIPPHNLREVVSALVHLIDNPEATPGEIRKFIKGPDFPTGGYIYGRAGIKDYQETGRGRIIMRARAVIEEKESSNKSQIVITEIPYQVNSAKLEIDIADLVRDKKLDGISDIRNESSGEGMRIVIELKRDAIPRVVLNQLYKHTSMQSTFGVIMLALVPDASTGSLVPKVMPLKEVLEHYIKHRHEVIVRRTQFDLDKALEREHIAEGLKIAVDNIDAVIKVIRAAEDTPTASTQLQKRFKLSERQAEAILNMRLAKLTGLEIEKLEEELKEIRATIKELKALLESKDKRMKVLKDELADVAKKYGDERRTEITSDEGEFTIEDLIAEEEMVVTISHSGYIKRTSVSTYKKQRRGGRGNNGAALKEEDFIEHLFVASTHDYVLVFTDDGRCFWLKVHEIPQAGRAAKGKPIVNMINVSPETQVSAMVAVRDFPDDQFLLFSTQERHGQEDRAVAVLERARQRHQGDQDRGGRRADRRAGDDRHERHRARHAPRPVDPLPRAGRARDGSRHHRREGHRARAARSVHRHGRHQARSQPARRHREGPRQVLADRRLPRPEARRQGHHHRASHRQDGRRRVDQGSAARRRADAHHQAGRRDPDAGQGHSRRRPQHAGRAAREPRRERSGDGRRARGAGRRDRGGRGGRRASGCRPRGGGEE